MATVSPVLLSKIFSDPSATAARSLPDQCLALLEQQRQAWPMLRDGAASLESVRVRELVTPDFRAFLQFNPKRIVSTGAKVDAKTIQTRRCFLCVEHLPEEQQGILVEEEFLVLCNPMPIFPQHYTISNIAHVPQALADNVGTMLRLARDLSPSFSVFYNGPKCGASAPDHLHFQACPAGAIPVEGDVARHRTGGIQTRVHSVSVGSLASYGREVLVVESSDERRLDSAMRRLIGAMQEVVGTTEEPMMNVIVNFRDRRWQVILFPRSKHRPRAYFEEGDAQVLISPAAVDIGGLVVTPLERDFNRVDAAQLEAIYAEVSVTPDVTRRVLERAAR